MVEDIFWLWLSMNLATQPRLFNRIIDCFANGYEVFRAGRDKLMEAGFNEKLVNNLFDSFDEKALLERYDRMKNDGISISWRGREEFPDFTPLEQESPCVLYYKGNLPKGDSVGIVGTRRPTKYGEYMAERFGKELAMAGYSVISGMAMGIDAIGHKSVIEAGGNTYAILGCGVDICYPWTNKYLYDKIIDNGGIISEYPPGTQPLRHHFPLRNRIISGLCSKLLVVEAKVKSGSLITAELSLEYGKDVYAVPGRVIDESSSGCNNLIKMGAIMATSIEDIVTCRLDGILCNPSEGTQKIHDCKIEKNNIVLEKDLQVLYSNVDLLPISMEEIANKSGMEIHKALVLLSRLQLMGLIKEDMKNYYSRTI